MEKPLARQAGIGWQGKHTNLVSREFGSWLFLGEIYLSLSLEPDTAENDHCGTCRNCLDACPTKAFPAPYKLDARRCISYLTIEHRGAIAEELRPGMGDWLFGCDICQEVCPWNAAPPEPHPSFLPRDEYRATPVTDLLKFTQTDFSSLFRKSAIKRAKLAGMKRNVEALQNGR
jgi:epoxyqueuosine reductase